MYEFDGFVYGGEPTRPLRIIKVKVLDNKMMLLDFSTGERRLFDASILNDGAFEQLNDEDVFNNPKLEYGVVTWLNGEIDCSPEFMYEHSFDYPREGYLYTDTFSSNTNMDNLMVREKMKK